MIDDELELVRMAELAELGGTHAHEVGNAMTAVLALAQVGRRDPTARGDRAPAALFATIEGEVVRAIGILDRYAAAVDGRRRAVEARPIEVGGLVRSFALLVEPHLAMHQVSLELDAADPGVVVGRDGELRQILLNLILNARIAAGPGGRIRIAIGRAAMGMIEIKVMDTGPGVAEGMRDRVFDRFVTTRPGSGTGRGLALSRQIARDHGGDLVVEDGPLGGAAFVLRLPAAGDR